MNKLFISLLLFTTLLFSQESKINHLVFCWMDSTVTEGQIDTLIEETKKLSVIPGIIDITVGRPIQSERPIVDDSFSFGITMSFANESDMQNYLSDERHTTFVRTKIKPKLTKILVYDIKSEAK